MRDFSVVIARGFFRANVVTGFVIESRGDVGKKNATPKGCILMDY
jgi:hypothetical protein